MLRKIALILGVTLALYSNPSHAGLSDLKQKIRPYVVKALGEEMASKLLGPNTNRVELPEIPKVNKSALDSTVFDKKEDDKVKNIPEKEKGQLDFYYIDELYSATRNTKGNKNQLSRWFSILSQGGTREGVYRALVLDDTYRGLENYENAVNEQIIGFVDYFYPKFLNKKIQKEQLKRLNFYTLKRITTENALSIADEYIKTNKDNLYKWYAVFSGDLAKNYPKVFKNKLRRTTDMGHHKKWAETVPDQHIKSEVIIKLHMVCNFLQGKR